MSSRPSLCCVASANLSPYSLPFAQVEMAATKTSSANAGVTISSDLFQSYRALGFVTDSTPFHLKRLGVEHYVTCSIGKAWQVFNVSTLLPLEM